MKRRKASKTSKPEKPIDIPVEEIRRHRRAHKSVAKGMADLTEAAISIRTRLEKLQIGTHSNIELLSERLAKLENRVREIEDLDRAWEGDLHGQRIKKLEESVSNKIKLLSDEIDSMKPDFGKISAEYRQMHRLSLQVQGFNEVAVSIRKWITNLQDGTEK